MIHPHVAFHRLARRAVLRDAGGGRYYLDEPSWRALRGTRRRVALAIALLMVLTLLALVVTGIVSFGAASR
jgi:hypothetical protein